MSHTYTPSSSLRAYNEYQYTTWLILAFKRAQCNANTIYIYIYTRSSTQCILMQVVDRRFVGGDWIRWFTFAESSQCVCVLYRVVAYCIAYHSPNNPLPPYLPSPRRFRPDWLRTHNAGSWVCLDFVHVLIAKRPSQSIMKLYYYVIA